MTKPVTKTEKFQFSTHGRLRKASRKSSRAYCGKLIFDSMIRDDIKEITCTDCLNEIKRRLPSTSK